MRTGTRAILQGLGKLKKWNQKTSTTKKRLQK
jgi:hypothetical protein